MFGIGENGYFKYDHPRGRFVKYFDRLQDQVYKSNDTGIISSDYFEEFKKQINNLNIPSEWKSKYCFENINGRLERIYEKKTGYHKIEDVPVHEIIEYADILLSNYYEQEENKPYEEYKELFKNLKSEVKKNLSLKCLGKRLGIGDYFVQRVDDKVELIYNLGDGYVAKLPLQKQKIEEVLEAEKILDQPATLDIKDSGFGKIAPRAEADLEFAAENEANFAVSNFQFNNRNSELKLKDTQVYKVAYKEGFKKGFENGRNSIVQELDYEPIPNSIYYTPQMMYLDVKKFITRARKEFEETYVKKSKYRNGNVMYGVINGEEFAKLLEKMLVEEDKTELACALARSKM